MAYALRSGPAQDCDLVKPIHTIPISTVDEYDADKAVHCLLYVLKKLGGVADLYTLLKIIYFADKRHLERYGRFLFGDTYRAMKAGPVPSGAYDAIKVVRGDSDWCRPHPLAKKALGVEGQSIIALMESDLGLFSDSDLECLDEAIEEAKHLGWKGLWRRSHRDPAFRAADFNGEMSIEGIAKSLPNADVLLEYLRDPCPE